MSFFSLFFTVLLALLSAVLFRKKFQGGGTIPLSSGKSKSSRSSILTDIRTLRELHEVGASLDALIQRDGAGTWPPKATYSLAEWPAALTPYKRIYDEMAPKLALERPYLDDDTNRRRIAAFRDTFRARLSTEVDLPEVIKLLDGSSEQEGRISRDVYNAIYCCIGICRHAYRWATIPVVRVAQLEQVVDLPDELLVPWQLLQQHFGCESHSGNVTSNILLNFDDSGAYIFRINPQLSHTIRSTEENFFRIFREVELHALPVYRDMVKAIINFERNDMKQCAAFVQEIANGVRPVFSSYIQTVHNDKIALNAWMTHVQGFAAWGTGYIDSNTGDWVKFDGQSGNQALLFQALDAFLGLPVYLSEIDRLRTIPVLQREFCEALARHSFRSKLEKHAGAGADTEMRNAFEEIIKRLKTFRAAHRSRAHLYLSQPAPERLPMTAGKSVLKSDMEQSMEFLDQFMIKRMGQTV